MTIFCYLGQGSSTGHYLPMAPTCLPSMAIRALAPWSNLRNAKTVKNDMVVFQSLQNIYEIFNGFVN